MFSPPGPPPEEGRGERKKKKFNYKKVTTLNQDWTEGTEKYRL